MRQNPFILSLLLIVCLTGAHRAIQAAEFHATASDDYFWIVLPQPAENEFTLLARERAEEANAVHRIGIYSGQPVKTGLAALENELWTVFADHSVHVFRLLKVDGIEQTVMDPVLISALPEGVQLRSLAVNRQGPWALVRVEDAQTLQQIDQAGRESQDPPTQTITDEPADEPDPQDNSPGNAPTAVNADRLLHFDKGQWWNIPLPDEWPSDAQGHLIMSSSTSAFPRLVAISTAPQDGLYPVGVFTAVQTADEHPIWQRETYQLPQRPDLGPIVVEGQLIVGNRLPDSPQIAAQIHLLRDERVLPFGTLTIDESPAQEVNIVLSPIEGAIGLIARDSTGRTEWTGWVAMDLQRNVVIPSAQLTEQQPRPLYDAAGYFIMIGVMAVATLILFAFWNRDPEAQLLLLPPILKLSELTRRIVAAFIDLVPPVLITMWLFDLPFEELSANWDFAGRSFSELLPRLVLALLFVAITLLCELFTARTLGKLAVGIFVTDMKGNPPTLWQVVARNLLKLFDLIAWPLLLLTIIGPTRQRLGDLVAQTIVVSRNHDPEALKKHERNQQEEAQKNQDKQQYNNDDFDGDSR